MVGPSDAQLEPEMYKYKPMYTTHSRQHEVGH